MVIANEEEELGGDGASPASLLVNLNNKSRFGRRPNPSNKVLPEQIIGRWFAVASTNNHWFDSPCLTNVTAQYSWYFDAEGSAFADSFALRNESACCGSLFSCYAEGTAHKQRRWFDDGTEILEEPDEYWVRFSGMCNAPLRFVANEATRLWNWFCCTDRTAQDITYHYNEKGINPGIICSNGRPPMIGSLQLLDLEKVTRQSIQHGTKTFDLLIVGDIDRNDAWLLTRDPTQIDDLGHLLDYFTNRLFDEFGYPLLSVQTVHGISQGDPNSKKCFKCNIFLSSKECCCCCCCSSDACYS
jgi:lipocalin